MVRDLFIVDGLSLMSMMMIIILEEETLNKQGNSLERFNIFCNFINSIVYYNCVNKTCKPKQRLC